VLACNESPSTAYMNISLPVMWSSLYKKCLCCTAVQTPAAHVTSGTCLSKLISLGPIFQVISEKQVLHVASPGSVHASHALQLLLVMAVGHKVLMHCYIWTYTISSAHDAIAACLQLQVPTGIKQLSQWLRILCRLAMASPLLIRNKGRCGKH